MIEAVIIQNESGSQTLIIPDDLKIDDDKVYIKKTGRTLHIIPYHNAWQSMLNSLNDFSGDFMSERLQPDQQNRDYSL